MVVKLNLSPDEEKLTVKVRRYDDKRWILTAIKSRPEQSDKMAGSLILDEHDAIVIVTALMGIDPSHYIKLEGTVDLLRETKWR